MSLDYARTVLDIEIKALHMLQDRLDDAFIQVLDAMEACSGRVVTCGMGKLSHIAKKISTTLASTGTNSFYLHPGEALHGDLGMLHKDDLLLVFSYSGESREIIDLLPFVRMIGSQTVAITGSERSTLATQADKVLCIGPIEEACPLGLAPSATSTAMLALGDALSLCLMKRKGFQIDDYAKLHPGGALGKKTLPIESAMRVNEAVATVAPTDTVRDSILAITQARSGAAAVVDAQNKVLGIFCDGDLRRGIEDDSGFLDRLVETVMTKNCACIKQDQRVGEVLAILNEKRIGEAPVVDGEGRLVGMADLKTLAALI